MNEFIPYLLILIAWHPDQPGKIEVERVPGAFASVADCEDAGAEMLTKKDTFIVEGTGGQIMVRCVLSATNAEQDDAWAPVQVRLEGEASERRLEEENEQRYQREKAEYARNLIEEAAQKRKKVLEDAAWEQEYARQKASDKAAEEKSSNKAKPKT